MTCPFFMTCRRDWYDCGRVADDFGWPRVIEANGSGKVLSYEKDWATMIGCSGYVTYDINNTEVTIAFENPYTGSNKLRVGTGEESFWKNMEKHGYKEFTETAIVCNNGQRLLCYCKCTGGDTNTCTVILRKL